MNKRKHIVHIDRQKLARNIKGDLEDPAIIVRKGSKKIGNCDLLQVLDKDGKVVCEVITSYKEPLRGCGARAWIQTYGDVKMITNKMPEVVSSGDK
jgi:hypothetical protein